MRYSVLFFLFFTIPSWGQNQVIAVVNDNQEPIKNVLIIHDDRDYTTDRLGKVTLKNITFPTSVYCCGEGFMCKTVAIEKLVTPFVIQLNSILIEEVLVKGKAIPEEINVAKVITSRDILKSSSVDISTLLEKESGVSITKTGGTIAKPIIHGLQGKRVSIIDNGVKMMNQDWADHHGIEIDATTAHNIKIIKGANALKYGNGALGGSIAIEEKPLALYHKNLQGNAKTTFYSNGKGVISSAKIGGRIDSTAFTWRGQGSYKRFGNYKTPSVYLTNTAHQQHNYQLALGYNTLKTKIEASFTAYRQKLGVFTGSRIASQDDLERYIQLGRPATTDEFSYKISAPNQDVYHQMYHLKAEHSFDENWKVKADYCYQNNHRKEYEVRRNGFTSTPVNNVKLESHQSNVGIRYAWQNIRLEVGSQWAKQDNSNVAGTGVVPVLPNYLQKQVGGFFIAQYAQPKYVLEGGLRYDHIDNKSKGLDLFGNPYGGENTFNATSYQLGGKYYLNDDLTISLHTGFGWRTPNPYELYARGLEHGSAIYTIGNDNLKAEGGLKTIASVTYKTKIGQWSTSLYRHHIKDYIFSQYDGREVLKFSGVFPVYTIVQEDALFQGFDVSFQSEEFYNFRLSANFSYLRGTIMKDKSYLPQMPPSQFYTTLSYRLPYGEYLKSVELSHQYSAKQTRYSADKELLPNPPAAYHLVNLDIFGQYKQLNWKLGVDNLFNTEYSLYTDHFRYFANQAGRNIHLGFWVEF